MINLFGDEELRPVVWRRKEVPDYYLNRQGKVWSSKRSGEFLTPSYEVSRQASGLVVKTAVKYNLSIPKGMYEDYNFSTYGKQNVKWEIMTIRVHRAMMETWKPLEENPPKDLLHEWDSLSEIVKLYIEGGMVVDHWDDNPLNNHLENLRWCTSLENSNHRKKKQLEAEYVIMETENKTPLEVLIK